MHFYLIYLKDLNIYGKVHCFYYNEGRLNTLHPAGIYRAVPMRVHPRQSNVRSVYKTHIDAIHFRKTDEKRLHGLDQDGEQKLFTEDRVQTLKELAAKPDVYERLASALAPSIYEHEDIKKVRGGKRYDLRNEVIGSPVVHGNTVTRWSWRENMTNKRTKTVRLLKDLKEKHPETVSSLQFYSTVIVSAFTLSLLGFTNEIADATFNLTFFDLLS